ncbi:hypothetical protein SBY92_004349 [Candida maltosa Xu316]
MVFWICFTFGIIPTILTWIAVNNFGTSHLKSEGGAGYDHEKVVGETPRHSGDAAAVAPSGVPNQE